MNTKALIHTLFLRFAVFTIIGLVAALMASLTLVSVVHAAETDSPVGLWTTIDDTTGKPRGQVRIYEQSGKLYGKLEKSFQPGADSRGCTKCTDERKNNAIIGLILIRNMVRHGDEYEGGDILDPESGSVYRCKLVLEDGGKKLKVRGFIGVSLLGRTQVWERAE